MKHLTLVRHAKSSWTNPSLDDFDRPLNPRGLRDAPRMAERFAETEPVPDLIVSSPAARARATAEHFAEALDFGGGAVAYNDRLYHASSHGILEVIADQDDAHRHVVLFGHNPGLTNLANLVADAGIDNVPTTGVVRLELGITEWTAVDAGVGRVLDFDYPKRRDHV